MFEDKWIFCQNYFVFVVVGRQFQNSLKSYSCQNSSGIYWWYAANTVETFKHGLSKQSKFQKIVLDCIEIFPQKEFYDFYMHNWQDFSDISAKFKTNILMQIWMWKPVFLLTVCSWWSCEDSVKMLKCISILNLNSQKYILDCAFLIWK